MKNNKKLDEKQHEGRGKITTKLQKLQWKSHSQVNHTFVISASYHHQESLNQILGFTAVGNQSKILFFQALLLLAQLECFYQGGIPIRGGEINCNNEAKLHSALGNKINDDNDNDDYLQCLTILSESEMKHHKLVESKSKSQKLKLKPISGIGLDMDRYLQYSTPYGSNKKK